MPVTTSWSRPVPTSCRTSHGAASTPGPSGPTHAAAGGRAALSPEYFLTTGAARAADLVPRAARLASRSRRPRGDGAGGRGRGSGDRRPPRHPRPRSAAAELGVGALRARSSTSWLATPADAGRFDAYACRRTCASARRRCSRGRRSPGTTSASIRPAFGAPSDAGPTADGARRLRCAARASRSCTSRSARCSTRHRGCWRPRSTGLRELRIRLVVTTGPGVAPEAFGPQPPNVRIVEYVPHDLFLERCDVVVSHAGAGIMFGALANGLPQLLLPQGADQFANADACRDAGVAVALAHDEVTAEEVGMAVRRLLVSPSFWANAVADPRASWRPCRHPATSSPASSPTPRPPRSAVERRPPTAAAAAAKIGARCRSGADLVRPWRDARPEGVLARIAPTSPTAARAANRRADRCVRPARRVIPTTMDRPSQPIPVVLVLADPLGGAPVDALCGDPGRTAGPHRGHLGLL